MHFDAAFNCHSAAVPPSSACQGFYYDAFYGDKTLNEEHFKKIESWASKATKVRALLAEK